MAPMKHFCFGALYPLGVAYSGKEKAGGRQGG
jgi:hypothetical protein